MLPWGTCDSKVPKEPFSFMDNDNAITKADKWLAGGALHAKGEVGRSMFITIGPMKKL